MGFYIVLQYQPTQGACGFILVGGEKTDELILSEHKYTGGVRTKVNVL